MKNFSSHGYTLMELLVVIAVVAITAIVTPIIYDSSVEKTKISATLFDMSEISKAVQLARYNTETPVKDITGEECTACACDNIEDLSLLSENHPCVTKWDKAIHSISDVSDIAFEWEVRDKWGNPFIFDENEGVDPNNPCQHDELVSAGRDGKQWTEDDIRKEIPFYSPDCTGQ